MHDYKKLYLRILNAASEAIMAMERMNFGAARDILDQAQREAEAQWLKEAEEGTGMLSGADN